VPFPAASVSSVSLSIIIHPYPAVSLLLSSCGLRCTWPAVPTRSEFQCPLAMRVGSSDDVTLGLCHQSLTNGLSHAGRVSTYRCQLVVTGLSSVGFSLLILSLLVVLDGINVVVGVTVVVVVVGCCWVHACVVVVWSFAVVVVADTVNVICVGVGMVSWFGCVVLVGGDDGMLCVVVRCASLVVVMVFSV
jgi:hypothetical protein